jgi:hypothetical protein
MKAIFFGVCATWHATRSGACGPILLSQTKRSWADAIISVASHTADSNFVETSQQDQRTVTRLYVIAANQSVAFDATANDRQSAPRARLLDSIDPGLDHNRQVVGITKHTVKSLVLGLLASSNAIISAGIATRSRDGRRRMSPRERRRGEILRNLRCRPRCSLSSLRCGPLRWSRILHVVWRPRIRSLAQRRSTRHFRAGGISAPGFVKGSFGRRARGGATARHRHVLRPGEFNPDRWPPRP